MSYAVGSIIKSTVVLVVLDGQVRLGEKLECGKPISQGRAALIVEGVERNVALESWKMTVVSGFRLSLGAL